MIWLEKNKLDNVAIVNGKYTPVLIIHNLSHFLCLDRWYQHILFNIKESTEILGNHKIKTSLF